MEKVAILARVSTQGQDYERQVVELTDYCQRMNWEVVKVFANKVSGATGGNLGAGGVCQRKPDKPCRMP